MSTGALPSLFFFSCVCVCLCEVQGDGVDNCDFVKMLVLQSLFFFCIVVVVLRKLTDCTSLRICIVLE